MIARLTHLMIAAGVALLLQGCGFTPLYATNQGGGASAAVTERLAAVTIRPIADRDGIKLRQQLRERLQPSGAAEHPRYDLDVQMRAVTQELGVRTDATSSRANLIYTVRFALIEGGRRIYADTAQAIVSYNILDDQYATVTSVGNAGDRAIKQLGEEIRTRLAIYFDNALHETASTK